MMNDCEYPVSHIALLTLIAGRKQKDALINALHEAGGRGINTVYGRGSVKASYLRDVFGLVAEENKVMITCLLSGEKADAVLEMLIDEFHFDKPNTGIAFTIPVEELAF